MSMDPAVLTLIGTLCGGIGLKVTEHFFSRNKSRFDDASRIRDELRMEITSQREEIERLETERDKYRDSYYDLREQFSKVQIELTLALNGIKAKAAQAESIASPPTPDPIKEN